MGVLVCAGISDYLPARSSASPRMWWLAIRVAHERWTYAYVNPVVAVALDIPRRRSSWAANDIRNLCDLGERDYDYDYADDRPASAPKMSTSSLIEVCRSD